MPAKPTAISATRAPGSMSPPGRQGPQRGPFVALGEFRSAQHEGALISAKRVAANAAENRRADLVRVAARLFRAKGFDATTIREIAPAVGMRSGSPFYHFPNKHELLMAVMEEGLRLGIEHTQDALGDAARPAAQRFAQLVRTHYGSLHDTGSDFIPVMLYDWRVLPTQYKRRIIELKDRYDAIWQRTLDELHAGPVASRPEAGAADDPRRDQFPGDLLPRCFAVHAQGEPGRPRRARGADRRAGVASAMSPLPGRPKVGLLPPGGTARSARVPE